MGVRAQQFRPLGRSEFLEFQGCPCPVKGIRAASVGKSAQALDGGCRVGFFVDFEFKSRLLQRLIEVLFSEAVRRMVGAFEKRARDLYGSQSQPVGQPVV